MTLLSSLLGGLSVLTTLERLGFARFQSTHVFAAYLFRPHFSYQSRFRKQQPHRITGGTRHISINLTSPACDEVVPSGLTIALFHLGNLVQVSELLLRCNRISKLPNSWHFLENLKNLDLSTNELSELPSSIGGLKTLHTFFIQHNKIESLPGTVVPPNEECSAIAYIDWFR